MNRKQYFSYIFLAIGLALLCISLFGSYLFKSIMTYFGDEFQSFINSLIHKYLVACYKNNADYLQKYELYQYCNRETILHTLYRINYMFISPITSNIRYNLLSVALFNNVISTCKNISLFFSGICLTIYYFLHNKKRTYKLNYSYIRL